MRRFFKILLGLLAFALIVSIGAIAVSAEEKPTVEWIIDDKSEVISVDELPQYSVGDFAVYNGASYVVNSYSVSANRAVITLDKTPYYYSITSADGKVKYGNTPGSLATDFANAASGSYIKLLGNVTVFGVVSVSNKTIYFDLNGFYYATTLAYTKNNGSTSFSVKDGSQMYVFSTREGGKLFNASYQEHNSSGTQTSLGPLAFSTFTVSNADTRIFLGEFGKEGDEIYAKGDNVSMFGAMLVELYAFDTDPDDEIANVNINGGSYYRILSNHTAMFLMRDSAVDPAEGSTGTINVDGANLWSVNHIFGYANNVGTVHNKIFKASVNNSVLYSASSVVRANTVQEGRSNIDIYNSYILSDLGIEAGDVIRLHVGCRILNEAKSGIDGCITAKTIENKRFNFARNTFSFTLSEDKLSASITPSSFDVEEYVASYKFTKVIATEETSSSITWKYNDEVKTETWFNGIVPTSPIPLPESTDVYAFSFGNVTEVNGDKTYVATQVANFSMKINLSLYSDFFYNLYIPAEYHDAVIAVGASDKNGNRGEVSEGGLVTIYGVPYYKYSYGIIASKGGENFYYNITLKGYKGEAFTQDCLMSIPTYSVQVLDGAYNESSKNLVIKTLAYIRAACQYFGTDYSAIDQISETVEIPNAEKVDGIAMGQIPDEISKVISSSLVVLGDQVKFRFYLKSTADLSVETKVSYKVGSKTETVILREGDGGNIITEGVARYYEVSLHASDIRSDIVITRNGESFTYNLAKYIYGIKEDNNYLKNLVFYNLWDYSIASEEFKNEALDVGFYIADTPVTEYKIVADDPSEISAALILSKALGEKFGYTPEIVSEWSGKSIQVNLVSYTEHTDFIVYESNGNLIMNCTFKSFFAEAMSAFVKDYVVNPAVDVTLEKGFEKEYFTNKVYYSDFDVIGDGKTNDFHNIKIAHEIANLRKFTIYADAKTYYISTTEDSTGKSASITITTNTNFGNAEFIIDDTNISKFDDKGGAKNFNTNIFAIKSDYSSVTIPSSVINEINAAGGIDRDAATRFDFGLGYPAMLIITNKNNKQYIRYGTNANSGNDQKEVIIIDENGYISEETPFMFDFTEVTSIVALRLDVEPITIEGGTFRTLASRVNIANGEFGDYISLSRGISINRPNTTVKNITHVVEGEIAKFAIVDENLNLVSGNYTKQSEEIDGKTHYYVTDKSGNVVDGLLPFVGHSYGGFYTISNTSDVTIENCVMSARMYYLQGTYDINVTLANNVNFVNCTQSNFYESDGKTPNLSSHWGVMGSNYCKNIVYDGCMLTRYDAHCGVLGGKLLNSTVSTVSIIGAGDMLIENTTFITRGSSTSTNMITLRSDYGSTWEGTLTIKDCTVDYAFSDTLTKVNLITATYTNHYFGYETHLPNVVVDNLKFADKGVVSVNIFQISTHSYQPELKGQKMYDADRFILADGSVVENVNPYRAPDFIVVKNNNTDVKYIITDSAFFDETSLVGIEGGSSGLPIIK